MTDPQPLPVMPWCPSCGHKCDPRAVARRGGKCCLCEKPAQYYLEGADPQPVETWRKGIVWQTTRKGPWAYLLVGKHERETDRTTSGPEALIDRIIADHERATTDESEREQIADAAYMKGYTDGKNANDRDTLAEKLEYLLREWVVPDHRKLAEADLLARYPKETEA